MATSSDTGALAAAVRGCTFCAPYLPLGARPIVQIGRGARLLIASQAPGRRAHRSGRPFADRSGEVLRRWLGLAPEVFYDPERVAILPTGFCYPGTGPGGDLPPRPECAQRWHGLLLAAMPEVRLKVLIGRHAQRHHLGARARPTLTATVAAFADYLPVFFPLPHPSPRNGPWFLANPWFERHVLPVLRAEVRRALDGR